MLLGTFVAIDNCANTIASKTDKEVISKVEKIANLCVKSLMSGHI